MLNDFDSKLFYRDGPFIENVCFVETRKNFFVFKTDEQSFQTNSQLGNGGSTKLKNLNIGFKLPQIHEILTPFFSLSAKQKHGNKSFN